nr:cyclic AMP dependent transcription factor ATF 6 [Hymenolepis microstoma]
MLSEVDFSDETLSFALDGSNDEFFNFEMSNMLGDINFDNLNLPDEALGENILDTSDSDSGISNHGDKHPFLCDIEQGNLDVPESTPSTETSFFPLATTVSSDTVDSDPYNNVSYSQPHRKRPKPQEPLITGFAPVTSRQISSSSLGVSRTLSMGSVPLKLETRNFTSTVHQIPSSQTKSGEIINHHLPPKMPRILSRGQNGVNRFVVASSNQPAFVQPTPFCYTTTPSVNIGKSEIADSSASTTASISDPQQHQKPHLLPSVVSLPVIDELTFSNSFHVISPPTETESIEKLVKKQERMIKNRQAACLSRLRKKEYLERLEIRLDQLRQENAHLRQENNEWRNRYDLLEKSLGDLQAEYASLRRVSQTGTGGGSDDSSSSSSSTSSLNQSSLLSPSATTAPSVPRFAPTTHAVLPKSSKQQTSALPLQQPLLLSATSSSRFSNCITSKFSLLRKSQQPADRIVFQKPTTGNTGGISLLGSGSRFLPVVGGGGSNITLPCGVRKKVTTSLFILACLFAVNFSVTPFGQLSSPFSVVAMTSEYDSRILKPSLTSRALFSVPVASDNHSEATAVGQQTRKNLTNITTVNDKPSANVTAAVVTEIGRCHPDEIIDLMNQQMWLVLDNEDDDTELPLLERQEQTAHSRHVNSTSSSNLTVSSHELPPSERRRLIHDSLSSRFQHNKPKRAFLVRRQVKEDEEDEAEWNEVNGLAESRHPENDAQLLSNLTIFLQNSKLSDILPIGANSTEKSIRLCKLQVKVSSLKDLRRRWKV